MSINLPSLMKLTLAGALLVSVGACKPSDKGQGALNSEGVKALNLSKSDSQVFAKYFETEPCEVDEMEALGALAGLGLGESGADGMTFKSRVVNGGLVTYTDLALQEDESDRPAFKAKSAVFHCPQMRDDSPVFNRVDLTDITVFDEQDDIEFTAETLNIAAPSNDGARAIVENMTSSAGGSLEPSFSAMSITGVKMTSDEMNGTLGSFSFGKAPDEDGTNKADASLDDLNFKFQDPSGGEDMTLTFEGMSVRDFNLGEEFDTTNMSPEEIMTAMVGTINPFEKGYDEFLVEPLKFDSAFFSADVRGMEAKTTKKSGIVTTRQNLKPMIFKMKPAAGENPEFAQVYQMAKSLGFETLEMSGSSVTKVNEKDDSVAVSDGLFEIKDTVRFNFEYGAEGVAAMSAKVKELTASDLAADITPAYGELSLRNFRMSIEDQSIIERGLKLGEETTGIPAESLKLSMGMLALGVGEVAENDLQAEVLNETVGALVEWVNKGGTLTVEANPPKPVSFESLMGGDGDDIDPSALGFSAKQSGKTK